MTDREPPLQQKAVTHPAGQERQYPACPGPMPWESSVDRMPFSNQATPFITDTSLTLKKS